MMDRKRLWALVLTGAYVVFLAFSAGHRTGVHDERARLLDELHHRRWLVPQVGGGIHVGTGRWYYNEQYKWWEFTVDGP